MYAPRPALSVTLRGALLLLVVAVVGSALTVLGQVLPDARPAAAATTLTTSITCGSHDSGIAAALREGPELCAHEDAAPAGVDVRTVAGTAELNSRDGAGDEAVQAAATVGVVSAASTASDGTVECDGDGTSGFRVQAMYVVEAGKADRYSSVVASIRTWAAGVDDVVNRSAALTGGVRHVRFVTEKRDDGSCAPTVLHVTVPAGANADLTKSTAALAKLGYDASDRKYLSWTDANVYCGIAWMYTDAQAGQANANNGGHTAYARVDNACWGLADSVEAHELTHTLGAVQPGAPHATAAGHCTDDSDRMCYVDGAGVKMTQVCPAGMEALLDCGSDDYFSTSARSGSYLAAHWNAADNRFLIGGGNGTTGAGSNTSQRPVLTVQANPMVPGLSTQIGASVTPFDGRTVRSIAFVPDGGCTVAARAATSPQASLTCKASVTSASVTVTATDSAGSTGTLTKALELDTTPRPVTLRLLVNGAAYNASSVCATTGTLTGAVLDQATGRTVTGLPVGFRRGATSLGTAATGSDGRASITTTLDRAAYTATAEGAAGYTSAATDDATLEVATCLTSLSTKPAARTVKAGAKITVTGRLMARPSGGAAVPAVGEKVTVTLTPKGAKAITLGTAVVTRNGTWTVTAAPRATGRLTATHAKTTDFTASTAKAGSVTVKK